jgi:hypothetical protein
MKLETVAGGPADPTLQFTDLIVGGKTYKLIFDFDSIAFAEAQTGIPLLVGIDWSKITAVQMRAMLYASMLRGQPQMKDNPAKSLEEVAKLLRPKNMIAIESALVKAWGDSTPENPDPLAPALEIEPAAA